MGRDDRGRTRPQDRPAGLAAATRSRPNEFVSLAERMGYLHGVRAGFAVVAMAFVALTPNDPSAPLRQVGLATIAYLSLAALTEVLRRHDGGRRLGVVGWTLLADGVYIAWLMYHGRDAEPAQVPGVRAPHRRDAPRGADCSRRRPRSGPSV